MRRAARPALWVSLGLALAACAGPRATPAGPEPMATPISVTSDAPADYRQIAAKAMRTLLRDPDSVRDPEITEPARGFVGVLRGGRATVVCVRLNARNGFGGYTGSQATALIFRAGRVVDIIADQPLACERRYYAPFPEMLPSRAGQRH